MNVEFKEYGDIEDYQFDNGFDLTENDIKGLKDKEDNKLFDDQSVIFIKNLNGRLLVEGQYNKFLISVENEYDLKSGLYPIEFDRNGKGDWNNKIYTNIILEEEDFGVGLYSLLLNTIKCNRIDFEITQYGEEQKSESGCWFNDDYLPNNWKELFKDMTEDEIEKNLKDEFNKEIKQAIEEYKIQQKEKEDERNEKNVVDDKIDNGLPFEIVDNKRKMVYDVVNNTLTYYEIDKNDKEIPNLRLKFKSYDYFKQNLGHRLYNVKSIYSSGSVKNYLADYDISFQYEEYKDDGLGNGDFEYRVAIDFENGLFNNIKVAKGKIKFLFNRALDESFDVKYKDKKTIELLNRLSGIKVDVLKVDKIKSGGFEFTTTFSLHDRESFKINFLGQEKIVEWNVIKQYITSGCSVYTDLSKSKFLQFARDLGISNDVIAQQIKKTKILEKLKGEKDDKD